MPHKNCDKINYNYFFVSLITYLAQIIVQNKYNFSPNELIQVIQ